MIRAFFFALAVMGIAAVVTVPIFGSLALIHRHTCSRMTFMFWLTGAVIYVAAASAVITAAFYSSGLIAWVEA